MATRSSAATDVGRRREQNEDAYVVDADLDFFAVADGMGGHAGGEVASGLASRACANFVAERADIVLGFRDGSPSIPAWMVRRLIEDALHAACRTVFRCAQQDSSVRGMGTTLVSLLVAGRRAFVAHVGDSRCYLVRDGIAVQLTRDHSVVAEMLSSGKISEEAADTTFAQYRHALSRAVGVCEDVEVDGVELEVLPDDVFVLASDGFTQYVATDELPALVEGPIEAVPDRLVALANERGGGDNITAVAVRVERDPFDPEGDAERIREFVAKIETFRRIPLFRHLDYGELLRVLSTTDVSTLDDGEVVLREGEAGDAMYLVLSGRVALQKDGRQTAEFGPGSHFGEVSLIDRAPRSATAIVVSRARLLRLRREHLQGLVKREPDLAVKVLWSFAETLGERLRGNAGDPIAPRAAADGLLGAD